MDSVHAVDNVVFVDNVDLTNGIRSSIEKVHKVNKVGKEYTLTTSDNGGKKQSYRLPF